MESTLTSDTQAVLLLCGELGQRGGNGPKPLTLRLYNTLANWLKSEGLRPGDLLSLEAPAKLRALQTAELNPDRITPLLDRGAALALVVERWERSGLWVLSRGDAAYPDRLKRYLGHSAPPLLYGVGSMRLLGRGGLTIVGSRERSEEDAAFAQKVGEQCARHDIAVISGAAKGIDRDAMLGALEAGGWALGVLAEGLAKTATSGQFRAGLVNDHLTLVSPFDPDSRWLTYAAMERNKLLYGLGDAALVVASALESGGTWAGATDALRQRRVRVFVKSTGTLAPGNHKLLSMGATPFPPEPWTCLPSLLAPIEDLNDNLFSNVPPLPVSPSPTLALSPSAPPAAPSIPAPPLAAESQAAPSTQPTPEPACDAYSLVVDAILTLLKEPQADEWLAGKLSVRLPQVKDWLDRGVREGRILKLRKPVRYITQTSGLFTMSAQP